MLLLRHNWTYHQIYAGQNPEGDSRCLLELISYGSPIIDNEFKYLLNTKIIKRILVDSRSHQRRTKITGISVTQ